MYHYLQVSPSDGVVLGHCAHHLAEEAYGQNHTDDPSKMAKYRKDAGDLFARAMIADPSNVNNILWYAKFLHKTGQIGQVRLFFSTFSSLRVVCDRPRSCIKQQL
jgi:hypothetical protein